MVIKNNLKISIVIPVYRSVASIEELSEQISVLKKHIHYNIEIIFVNDSPEFYDTCNALEKIKQNYENVSVLTLRKNQGQHLALLVGLNAAAGDYIITMDDDLQHPVKEIPKLIDAIIGTNVEAVFAVPRYSAKKHSLWRNIASIILNKIDTYFLQKPKGLVKSPFRIMTRGIAKAIVQNYNATPAVSSLIIHTTNSIINVEVEHNKREYGKSNYTLKKMFRLTLNNLLHYSSLPLKLVGLLGMMGFLFSIGFMAYVFYKKIILGIDFPGYASTVSLISFFGGLNLLANGIVGEYLIRIIKEQQKVELQALVKEKGIHHD
jgi:glycosyltransferase involved in cell wall biosynthesis